MAFSLFPDERPVVISPPLKGAPPIFMPPCSITSLDNPNTNKLESFRSFNLYSRRDTPLPDASLFQDFLRRNCTSLPADEPLTTGAVLSHLAHHIQDLDFWRRMTMELLDIVVATAPSPPSNSSCAGTSCEAPKRGRKRSSVVLPREHVTSRPDESPALLRSPTAMLAKAVVGEEADDGSFTINQHVILLPLGHGAQGEVLLAMDTARNELRAIKAIQRPKGIPEVASGGDTLVTRGALGAAKAARRSQLEREINIMKRCRHRNIVALHEVIDDPELDVMYLVMQYVEKGPIAKLRPDWTIECPIDPVKLAGYTVQMCAGLAYLHRKGVIHRDIKPDNVLIGNHDDVYLADFGTADLFQTDQSKRISDHRGTAAFMAPEMFAVAADGDSSSSAQGELIDIWALGITLFVLLYGKLPWQSVSPRELRHEVSKAELTFPSPATQRKKMTVPEDDGQPYSQDDPLNDVPRLESSQSLPTFLTVEALDDENGVELPSFSCDVTMHSSFSTGDAISPMSRTVNNLRLTAAQHRRRVAVQDASSMWAALLAGILQKDPARRLSLASISSQAQEIIDHHNSGSSAHQGSMGRSGSTSMRADGSDNAEPITRRQHHSS